ncbi:hypothetical protein FB157_125154 [Streptomyces sp. BK340]|nr:hypothetical protein FB157_125154 [Streptomyces sp. BK340]
MRIFDEDRVCGYLTWTRPSVVTVGRPRVPTTTIFTVCLALLDQVLVQRAWRYWVVVDFRSTVAVLVPSVRVEVSGQEAGTRTSRRTRLRSSGQ